MSQYVYVELEVREVIRGLVPYPYEPKPDAGDLEIYAEMTSNEEISTKVLKSQLVDRISGLKLVSGKDIATEGPFTVIEL